MAYTRIMKNYIEINNTSKTFNHSTVLSIESYTIPIDGIVAILGFSGNGKTTLLNIISLIDTPDEFFIKLDNSKALYII